jgi:hypothetical protein
VDGQLYCPLGGLSAGAKYARIFERPWIMLLDGSNSENIRPVDNQHGYYSECHSTESDAAMLLCCDIPDKEAFLINFIQYGIDTHYCAKHFVLGEDDRGDRCMSKWPGMYAGILLENEELRTSNNGYSLWKTDDCTYYGAGWTNSVYRPVGATVLWKMDNTTEEQDDHETIDPFDGDWCQGVDHDGPSGNPFWNYEGYRRWTHSWTWIGTKNAATIMGAKTYWNHNAFFDYVDRWATEDESPWFAALDYKGKHVSCGDAYYPMGYQSGDFASHFQENAWDLYHDYVFVAEPEEPEEGPWVMIYG